MPLACWRAAHRARGQLLSSGHPMDECKTQGAGSSSCWLWKLWRSWNAAPCFSSSACWTSETLEGKQGSWGNLSPCLSPPWLVCARAPLGAPHSSQQALLLSSLSSAHCSAPSLCSWQAVLECQPALLGLFALQGSFSWDAAKQVLEEDEICSSKSQGCNSAVCLTPLGILNYTVSWPLQPRLPFTFASSSRSSMFVSSRSNRASTLVGRKRAQGVVLPRKWPVCFMSVRDHTVQIKKGTMFNTRWQQLEILFFSFPFSINSLYKAKKTELVWAFVSLLAVPAPVLFCSTFLPCIQRLLFVRLCSVCPFIVNVV